MTDMWDDLQKAIDRFSEDMYNATTISFANSETLLKLNMNDIPTTMWFIANGNVEENIIQTVIDEKLKREMYNFFEEKQDRIFRGKKVM